LNESNYIQKSFQEFIADSNQILQEYAVRYSDPEYVTVEESRPTTLAGYPAHELVYASNTQDSKIMHLFAKVDNRIYMLTYGSESGRYSDNLPTVQEMINSFQITDSSPSSLSSSSLSEMPAPSPLAQPPQPQQPLVSIPDADNITTTPDRQSPSANLLTYENNTYGIKIKYPADWDYYESGEFGGLLDIVVFQSPLEGRTDPTSATFSVSTDTQSDQVRSLEEYVEELIPSLSEGMSDFNYKVVQTEVDNGIVLAGRPAYQLVSTYVYALEKAIH
jgi:PsbP-like protein